MAKIKNSKPEIRFLNEMKAVLYDQDWLKSAPNFELYYMYRGLKKKNDLRYDVTLIPPRMLGKEFVKTKGHDHLGEYGEIYIVLKGEAIYLLQKPTFRTEKATKNLSKEENKIEDVYAVKAKKGEVIIIPPFYGHVTINPSQKKLKMANWVSEKCKSDYYFFEKMKGGCYFYTKKGWIKNKNYKKTPDLKFKKPLNKIPEDLTFLK